MSLQIFEDAFLHLGFWGVLFSILLPFIFNPTKFKDLLDVLFYARSRKLYYRETAIESNYFDSLTHEAIKTQLSIDYFYKSTGIKVSSELRIAMLHLIKYSNNKITLYHFQKASSYLLIDQDRLHVKLPKFYKLIKISASYLFWIFAVGSILFTSLFTFKLANIDYTSSALTIFTLILATISLIMIMLWGAFVFLNVRNKIDSAEIINNYLLENEDFNNYYLNEKIQETTDL